MGDLGKYWAGAPTITANPLSNNPESGVSHRIDIAGVASSILATPTTGIPSFRQAARLGELGQDVVGDLAADLGGCAQCAVFAQRSDRAPLA